MSGPTSVTLNNNTSAYEALKQLTTNRDHNLGTLEIKQRGDKTTLSCVNHHYKLSNDAKIATPPKELREFVKNAVKDEINEIVDALQRDDTKAYTADNLEIIQKNKEAIRNACINSLLDSTAADSKISFTRAGIGAMIENIENLRTTLTIDKLLEKDAFVTVTDEDMDFLYDLADCTMDANGDPATTGCVAMKDGDKPVCFVQKEGESASFAGVFDKENEVLKEKDKLTAKLNDELAKASSEEDKTKIHEKYDRPLKRLNKILSDDTYTKQINAGTERLQQKLLNLVQKVKLSEAELATVKNYLGITEENHDGQPEANAQGQKVALKPFLKRENIAKVINLISSKVIDPSGNLFIRKEIAPKTCGEGETLAKVFDIANQKNILWLEHRAIMDLPNGRYKEINKIEADFLEKLADDDWVKTAAESVEKEIEEAGFKGNPEFLQGIDLSKAKAVPVKDFEKQFSIVESTGTTNIAKDLQTKFGKNLLLAMHVFADGHFIGGGQAAGWPTQEEDLVSRADPRMFAYFLKHGLIKKSTDPKNASNGNIFRYEYTGRMSTTDGGYGIDAKYGDDKFKLAFASMPALNISQTGWDSKGNTTWLCSFRKLAGENPSRTQRKNAIRFIETLYKLQKEKKTGLTPDQFREAVKLFIYSGTNKHFNVFRGGTADDVKNEVLKLIALAKKIGTPGENYYDKKTELYTSYKPERYSDKLMQTAHKNYLDSITSAFKKMFLGMKAAGIKYFIGGPVGCGAFANFPPDVAHALFDAFEECAGDDFHFVYSAYAGVDKGNNPAFLDEAAAHCKKIENPPKINTAIKMSELGSKNTLGEDKADAFNSDTLLHGQISDLLNANKNQLQDRRSAYAFVLNELSTGLKIFNDETMVSEKDKKAYLQFLGKMQEELSRPFESTLHKRVVKANESAGMSFQINNRIEFAFDAVNEYFKQLEKPQQDEAAVPKNDVQNGVGVEEEIVISKQTTNNAVPTNNVTQQNIQLAPAGNVRANVVSVTSIVEPMAQNQPLGEVGGNQSADQVVRNQPEDSVAGVPAERVDNSRVDLNQRVAPVKGYEVPETLDKAKDAIVSALKNSHIEGIVCGEYEYRYVADLGDEFIEGDADEIIKWFSDQNLSAGQMLYVANVVSRQHPEVLSDEDNEFGGNRHEIKLTADKNTRTLICTVKSTGQTLDESRRVREESKTFEYRFTYQEQVNNNDVEQNDQNPPGEQVGNVRAGGVDNVADAAPKKEPDPIYALNHGSFDTEAKQQPTNEDAVKNREVNAAESSDKLKPTTVRMPYNRNKVVNKADAMFTDLAYVDQDKANEFVSQMLEDLHKLSKDDGFNAAEKMLVARQYILKIIDEQFEKAKRITGVMARPIDFARSETLRISRSEWYGDATLNRFGGIDGLKQMNEKSLYVWLNTMKMKWSAVGVAVSSSWDTSIKKSPEFVEKLGTINAISGLFKKLIEKIDAEVQGKGTFEGIDYGKLI